MESIRNFLAVVGLLTLGFTALTLIIVFIISKVARGEIETDNRDCYGEFEYKD